METIGQRLKDERIRIGLNQEQIAALAGLKRMAQVRYEQGVRFPDAAYLQIVGEAGVDVAYVVTGRTGNALSDDESELVLLYRRASVETRANVLGGLRASQASKGVQVSVAGDVGQVVTGDQTNDTLTIRTGSRRRKD